MPTGHVSGAPSPSIRVLGTLEADSVELAPRLRRLLAAFVVRSDVPASADWLVEAVWGGACTGPLPIDPQAALQTLVSRLRAGLRGQGDRVRIETTPHGYRLRAEPGAVDARRFEDLLAAARHSGPRQRVHLLTEALGLWRGPAFEGVAEEVFAEAEAVRLTELRADAAEGLASAHLDLAQPAAALARLQPLVQAWPLRERPHAMLMRAQHQLGRTPEALRTFADFRTRLLDELGLDPSAELSRLHTDLLSGQTGHTPAGTATATARRTIRPPAMRLYGRDADRRDLLRALQTDRLVTVTGPGGLGKTTLALAAAADFSAGLADGGVLCELTAVPNGEFLPAAICTHAGLQVTAQSDPQAALLAGLAARESLLVLDNCEHLAVEAAALVAAVLHRCPQVRVLVTSRVPLRVPGEIVFGLAPLDTPGPGDRAAVAASPAVQLFLARARARVRGFHPEGGDLADIARLCRRLDGLPLAIELAASRMDALRPVELLERLPWQLTMLRGGPGGDPRHRTLRALVDWSFDRATAAEQGLFEIVSVFAGPFGLQDVEALIAALPEPARPPCEDAIGDLASLVEQSLAVRGPEGFTLLETMRAYGRERLARGPHADAVARAHAEVVLALTQQGDDLYGPTQLQCLARWQTRMGDVRQALTWSLAQAPGLAGHLLGGLAPLVEHRMSVEVVGWAEQVLASAEQDGGEVPSRVYAIVAAGTRFHGDLDRASELAGRAVATAGEDLSAVAYGTFLQGEVDLFHGDLATIGRRRARVAEAAAAQPGLLPLAAMTDILDQLARGYRGDAGAAQDAEQTRLRAERAGWPMVAAWAVYVRGELLREVDPATATRLLGEVLARARVMDDRYLLGVSLVTAASVQARHGDLGQARALFTEAVRHWRGQGDWTHQWTTLRNVLDLLVRWGRLEAAVVLATALSGQDRGATGYGEDACRLADTRAGLVADLEPDRHAVLVTRARGLSDHALVDWVLDTLEEAQPTSR